MSNPTLYDIHKSFDCIQIKNKRNEIVYNGIKGEFSLRMILFTNFILGKRCVAIFGSKSSGKSNIMSVVSSYALKPYYMDKASEKADLRDDKINEFSHVIVPEINKINNNQIEMLKDWGENKASEYKYTDVTLRRPISISIDPKPFVTSLADENDVKLGEELLSRVTILTTDSSVNMNQDVIKDKLTKALNPLKKQKVDDDEAKRLQSYVKLLPDINEFTFVYPAGDEVIKAIPALFTDSRRDTDKFLYNTYAIALFHVWDRIKLEFGKKKILFCTPADIWYNQIIYHDVLVQSSLKCSHLQKTILLILKEWASKNVSRPWMKINEIHKELRHRNLPVSISNIDGHIEHLYKNGYLFKARDGATNTYQIGDDDSFNFDFSVDWNRIVEACKRNIRDNYPQIADEYIKRFCTAPINVVHPYTGETIDITRYEESKPQLKKVITQQPQKTVTTNDYDKALFAMKVNKIMYTDDFIGLFSEPVLKQLLTNGEIFEDGEKIQYVD